MQFFAEQCPFYLAGILMGLLVVGMRWTGNLHLGALGSFVATQGFIARPTGAPSWRVLFLVGTAGGGLLYGLAAGDLHPTFANAGFEAVFGAGLATKMVILGSAGLLIGFGARMAGGCTSGHGICGVAQLSPGSVVSTATFVGTAIVVANLVLPLFARGS